MKNARFLGGGYSLSSYQERRTGTVISCSPIRLPKGGQRWINTPDKGGVIYG